MPDLSDVRTRLIAAGIAAEAQGRRIVHMRADDLGPRDPKGVTLFEALFYSEQLSIVDDPIGAVLESLGLDEVAAFWIGEGFQRSDIIPDPDYVDHYNLGLELAARFARPIRGAA